MKSSTIFPPHTAGYRHAPTSLEGVKRPLNGNSFRFAPEKEREREEERHVLDDHALLLDRFFTSPTATVKWVLLFPTCRWENRIREVKGQCQSLTAWYGCIQAALLSLWIQRHLFIPAASGHDPTPVGPLSYQALGNGEMQQDNRTGPALSLDTRQGRILITQREVLVRSSHCCC